MAGEALPEQREEGEGEEVGEEEQARSELDQGAHSVTRPELGEPVAAEGPAETARKWLFLVGHRLVVAAAFLLGVAVVFAGVEATLGLVDPAQPTALFYLFGGLIGGNFTLITIVISINQLVVSQQIGAPGELRDQIESTNAYREAVEESVDVPVAPVAPTEFLHLLLRSTADAVESVREETERTPGGEPTEELREATDDLYEHARRVESLITDSEASVFQALAAALDTNYSEEMNRLRRLRNDYGRHYSEEVVGCLDDLVVRLQQIDVARQYLKTIYVQDELSRLSRTLLYVGIPAVLVSAFVLRVFAAPETAVVAPEGIRAYLPLALALAIAPLAVLFSYVIRLSTVAQRTVAITPFTTATQERI